MSAQNLAHDDLKRVWNYPLKLNNFRMIFKNLLKKLLI